MEYRVIESPSAESLQKKVRLLLQAGWEVFGEVTVKRQKQATSYCQTLVRCEPQDGQKPAAEPS